MAKELQRITESQLESIKVRFERGERPVDIARDYPISSSNVSYHARMKGWEKNGEIPVRRKSPRRTSTTIKQFRQRVVHDCYKHAADAMLNGRSEDAQQWTEIADAVMMFSEKD